MKKKLQQTQQKKETSRINNLTLHLKQVEKKQQKTPKLAEGKK